MRLRRRLPFFADRLAVARRRKMDTTNWPLWEPNHTRPIEPSSEKHFISEWDETRESVGYQCWSKTCHNCGRVWLSPRGAIRNNAERGGRDVYLCVGGCSPRYLPRT